VECYWRLRGVSEIPVGISLGATIVACATLGAFFVGYKFQTATDCFVFPAPDLLAYPRFTALMAARFFGLMTPIRLAKAVGAFAVLNAAVLFSVLAWRIVEARRVRNIHLAAAVLLAFSILFSATAALGRVCRRFPAPRGLPGTRHFSYPASWRSICA
jgi:hypothetical protein